MTAAQQLLDQTRRDLDAARALREKNGGDLKRSRAQYDANVGARQTDQREVETLQRRLAENESVSDRWIPFRSDGDAFFCSKLPFYVVVWKILKMKFACTKMKRNEWRRKSIVCRMISSNKVSFAMLLNKIDSPWKKNCQYWNSNVSRTNILTILSSLAFCSLEQDRLVAEQPGYVSADLDPSKFFRNELASAIQEIRREYEDEMKDYQSRLQFQYDLLVNRYPQLNAARLPTSAPADDPNDRRRRQIHEQLLTERDHSRRYLAEQETLTAQINNLRQDIAKIDGQGKRIGRKLEGIFIVCRLLHFQLEVLINHSMKTSLVFESDEIVLNRNTIKWQHCEPIFNKKLADIVNYSKVKLLSQKSFRRGFIIVVHFRSRWSSRLCSTYWTPSSRCIAQHEWSNAQSKSTSIKSIFNGNTFWLYQTQLHWSKFQLPSSANSSNSSPNESIIRSIGERIECVSTSSGSSATTTICRWASNGKKPISREFRRLLCSKRKYCSNGIFIEPKQSNLRTFVHESIKFTA